VLFAGIVALGSSIVAGEVFHSERPEKMGYPIEGVEVEGEPGEAAKPIEFYLASADPAKGQQVFNKCTACHTVEKGAPNQLGPNLWGVLGEPVGKGHGFAFSPALAEKGGTWNWDNLSEWLTSPKAFAPGTKMTFAGISNPQDRANVIAFLNSKSDAPRPLPTAPAATAEGGAQKAPKTLKPTSCRGSLRRPGLDRHRVRVPFVKAGNEIPRFLRLLAPVEEVEVVR
jgi:cytochrome c